MAKRINKDEWWVVETLSYFPYDYRLYTVRGYIEAYEKRSEGRYKYSTVCIRRLKQKSHSTRAEAVAAHLTSLQRNIEYRRKNPERDQKLLKDETKKFCVLDSDPRVPPTNHT